MLGGRVVLLAALLGFYIWGIGVVEMRLSFSAGHYSIFMDACTDGSRLYVVEYMRGISPAFSVVYVRTLSGDLLGVIRVDDVVYACASDGNRLVLISSGSGYVYNKSLMLEKKVDLPKLPYFYAEQWHRRRLVDSDNRHIYLAWSNGTQYLLEIRRIEDLSLVKTVVLPDEVVLLRAVPGGVVLEHLGAITVVIGNDTKRFYIDRYLTSFYYNGSLYVDGDGEIIVVRDNATRRIEIGADPEWIGFDGEHLIVIASYTERIGDEIVDVDKFIQIDEEGNKLREYVYTFRYFIYRTMKVYYNDSHIIFIYITLYRLDGDRIEVYVVKKGDYPPGKLNVCYLTAIFLYSLHFKFTVDDTYFYTKNPCFSLSGLISAPYDVAVENTYIAFLLLLDTFSEARAYLPPGGEVFVIMSDSETSLVIALILFVLLRRLGII